VVLRTPEAEPNPENASVEELRLAVEAAPNKRSFVRLTAMRMLLTGITRAQVCSILFRTDRVVRLS
jgi:hypothetical protein